MSHSEDPKLLPADPHPQITLSDLEAMNLWCLSYKSKVRSGQVPTPEEDARYLTFLPFLHHTGYAYDH